MKRTITFIVVAALLLIVANKIPICFGSKSSLYSQVSNRLLSDDINKVRNGHLAGTSKVTISSALEGYFSSPRWGETVYYDMPMVAFQGEFEEDGDIYLFQILFPKYSEYKWLNKTAKMQDQTPLLDFDALPVVGLFVNTFPNEEKGQELLVKAYAVAGETLEYQYRQKLITERAGGPIGTPAYLIAEQIVLRPLPCSQLGGRAICVLEYLHAIEFNRKDRVLNAACIFS